MAALLMFLKQPSCIYLCTSLCLATLAVANAQEMLQPADEVHTSIGRSARTSDLASQPIEIAALGRLLIPGMLYDCRKDSFIPGVTLWDKKSLSEDLDSRPQVMTDLKFSSSDSLSTKSSLLDVSASLKASFLGGLVEVGGSASFLRDTKSSNQQSRITMYFREISRFEQLTMTHLGKITYPQVFDQKTATHVVTAVQYGAQSIMVFDRTVSDSESKEEIHGELNVMVKNIPAFSLEGKAKLQMTDAEKKMAEKISCTFHGDVRLKQNPTTYMEAVNLFKQLPDLLKENPENVVPIKVWLYPLHLLDTKAAQLEREISSSAVSKTEDIMEVLWDAERTFNDLFERTIVNVFSDIKERLRSFQSSFNIYKANLLKAIGRVLPGIRAGEMEEKSLEDILKIHRSSPFNSDMLNQWLNDAKSEVHILSSYTNVLKDIRIEDSDRLKAILVDPDIDVMVCLTFTSLQYEEPYLSTLKDFVKSDKFKELDGEKNMVSVASVKKWFNDPDVIARTRENVSRFRSFSEANKGEKKIRFIISAVSNPSSPGSSIYLYEKGKLTDTHFQLVSKPPPPIVKSSSWPRSVSLKMQKSPTGETVKYRVEYKSIDAVSWKQWTVVDTTDEDFTLTGFEKLVIGNAYSFKYRIIDKVGVSEASDAVSPGIGGARIVGGDSGVKAQYSTSSISTIKKISIYYEEEGYNEITMFKAIQMTFSNGDVVRIGDTTQWKVKEFIFHSDDKLVAAQLWLNKGKDKVRGLEFVAEKSNGERRTFSIKCKEVGDPVTLNVRSGKCHGVSMRLDNEFDALGFYFT